MAALEQLSSVPTQSRKIVKSLVTRLREGANETTDAQVSPLVESQVVSKCPTDAKSEPPAARLDDSNLLPDGGLQRSGSSPNPAQVGHPTTNMAMARTSNDISERQSRALDLLVAGQSDSEVAATIEVDRRTIYRWRHNPAFRRQLERLRNDLREVAKDRLHLLLPAAFQVLQQQLVTANDPNSYRAAAFIVRSVIGNSLSKESRPESAHDGTLDRLLGV